jgi:cellulose biosynthesis protein BcsQ/Flp pilus assembly protein TadD
MANMMAILGYRVLLIDLDFNTHGLSYFFEGYAKKVNVSGLLDTSAEYDLPYSNKARPLRYSANLHVLLSKTLIEQIVAPFKDEYQYVILDNQAGPNSFSISAMQASDKYVIVAEPDALSIAAARNMEYEMEGRVKTSRLFVLNKVFPEELENVEAFSNYLRLFDHLTPIPFDFEVRKSFSLKQIPFDDKAPTLYSVSIIRFIQEVFPELSKELSEKTSSLYMDYFEQLATQHQTLEKAIHNHKRWFLLTASSLTLIIVLGFLSMSAIPGMFGSRLLWAVVLCAGSALIFVAVSLIAKRFSTTFEQHARAEIESTNFLLQLRDSKYQSRIKLDMPAQPRVWRMGLVGGLIGIILGLLLFPYRSSVHLQMQPPSMPDAFLTQGLVLIERGDSLWNVHEYNEATGDYEKALESFEMALTYRRHFAEAWFGRGKALGRINRFGEAIASFDSALAFKGVYPEVWYSKGTVLFNLDRYQEAIANLDTALRYKHNYPEAWNNRGVILDLIERHNEALASADSALKYKADSPEAWDTRCVILRNLGRYKDAVANCDSALSYKYDAHWAWRNRALALQQLGHDSAALAGCDSALKYDPNDSLAIELRKVILEEMKE